MAYIILLDMRKASNKVVALTDGGGGVPLLFQDENAAIEKLLENFLCRSYPSVIIDVDELFSDMPNQEVEEERNLLLFDNMSDPSGNGDFGGFSNE